MKINIGLPEDSIKIDGRSTRWGTPEERFWEKVDKNGPTSPLDGTSCWTWTGAVSDQGYGFFRANGRMTIVHRFSYELASGSTIPIGTNGRPLYIDHRHTCPKTCVRPEHLRTVSPKQNSENRAGAQSDSTHGVRGVTWDKHCQKWLARVKHNGVTVHAGGFDTIEKAEAAAIAKRIELFTHNDADREMATNT